MKKIIDFDKWLFVKINREGTAPLLDQLMRVLREPATWIPLYIVLAVFLIVSFGKKGWWMIAYAAITVAVTDTISSHILKPLIGRLRPCNDPAFSANVRLLVDCGTN